MKAERPSSACTSSSSPITLIRLYKSLTSQSRFTLCVKSGKLAGRVLRGIAFQKSLTVHSALAATVQGLSNSRLRCGAHHTQLVNPLPLTRIPARFANIMGKATKRKADSEPAGEPAEDQSTAPSTSAVSGLPLKVNPKRVRELKGGEIGSGPVIYWFAAHLTCSLISIFSCAACT